MEHEGTKDWTHLLCDGCWAITNPGRTPVRVIDAEEETCCYCENKTTSGIFVRGEYDKFHGVTV